MTDRSEGELEDEERLAAMEADVEAALAGERE